MEEDDDDDDDINVLKDKDLSPLQITVT